MLVSVFLHIKQWCLLAHKRYYTVESEAEVCVANVHVVVVFEWQPFIQHLFRSQRLTNHLAMMSTFLKLFNLVYVCYTLLPFSRLNEFNIMSGAQ